MAGIAQTRSMRQASRACAGATRLALADSRGSEMRRWIQPKLSSVIWAFGKATPALALVLASVISVPRAQGRGSVTLRVNVNVVPVVCADGARPKRAAEAITRSAVLNPGAILVMLNENPNVRSQETLTPFIGTPWADVLPQPCDLSADQPVHTNQKVSVAERSEAYNSQIQPSADMHSSHALPCRVVTRSFLPR
jgi:hypothetical protein